MITYTKDIQKYSDIHLPDGRKHANRGGLPENRQYLHRIGCKILTPSRFAETLDC